MIAIRGAITVEANTEKDILESTTELLQTIMDRNTLEEKDILSIYFTGTKDLTKVYPAVAARDMGLTTCSLLCAQEMDIEGSLKMCIRVLLHVESERLQSEASHVYLRKAKSLRPDIA
jgi:chorismate mutase